MKSLQDPSKQVHRVVTFLDRSQVDYLDKLGKDALFSTGMKFPRTRIISSLIDLARKFNLGGEGLRTDQDLEERLLKKLSAGAGEVKKLSGELMDGGPHANSPRVRG